MPAIVIVGAQWGDEGKGKATDLLGDSVDYVVRYQGGNNAGHTVVIGEESFPTLEIHSLSDRIRVSNKALGVDSAAPIGHGFLLGFL